ncbi:uncharacterized protein LOC110725135 [Chenopodium quinoa]|uniref:uncharacterized protein LOC110725135 n=1 Tax=Chenopodium quinoa TaxID=63459 RepID=UPI000B77BD4E|nr:uncharacterized protein LOC110725135 [Chenopodium quinoa]
MSVSDKNFNEMMTHNNILETQITQLSNTLKDCASPSSLPSQGVDPKKPVYSITTNSGKVLKERVSRNSEEDEKKSDCDSSEEKEKDVSKSVSKEEILVKKKSVERVQEEVRKPDLPYPQKFMRNKLDEQFGRYVDMLKEVHLSIPLTEAMTQIPRYSKFLKDILSGKRECNEIDSIEFGASVSIMPYSVFKKLNLREILPTNMTLQLVDRSIMFPKGKVEDVPLRIGGFTILVDFIVLEIEEDDHISITLGRLLLATSGSLIDVKGDRITLRVGVMNDNSLRSLDNVCVINSSTNGVHEIFDDVLVKFDGMKVSKKEKELSMAKDEEVIDIPHWFELCPLEEEDGSKEVDGVNPSTRRNKAKKKARVSRKKRMRLKLKNEKVVFEV